MYKASTGGGAAARCTVYRHALVRAMSELLTPLRRQTGWCPMALAIAATLMGWDSAPTLTQRFEGALAVLDAALPRRRRTGRTYQGFIKALRLRSESILEALIPHLRAETEKRAGSHWRVGRFVPIAVDGSRFDAPRTVDNEALGSAGKDKCGPQMMTLLLIHLGTMLPWAWRIGRAVDAERVQLRDVLDELPEDTLLVADAGFTGFDLLSELHGRGVSFLIRVGRGVRLLRELGHYSREGKSTVYLWPVHRRDAMPLELRLIQIGSVYLITNVTDPRDLSAKVASELYRRRWGIEVAFRSLKQTLERRKVRSGTAVHARIELAWAIAGLWILMLLGVKAIATAGHAARCLSVAGALATVRLAARGHRLMSDRSLRSRLKRAVIDRYARTVSKKAYRYPHKKRPSPPGAPTIAKATDAQVSAARRLRQPKRPK